MQNKNGDDGNGTRLMKSISKGNSINSTHQIEQIIAAMNVYAQHMKSMQELNEVEHKTEEYGKPGKKEEENPGKD